MRRGATCPGLLAAVLLYGTAAFGAAASGAYNHIVNELGATAFGTDSPIADGFGADAAVTTGIPSADTSMTDTEIPATVDAGMPAMTDAATAVATLPVDSARNSATPAAQDGATPAATGGKQAVSAALPQQAAALPAYAYCEIIVSGLPAPRSEGVMFDFGQETGMWRYNYLQNAAGEKLLFHSGIEALNYMVRRGWEFVQAFTSGSANSCKHYLLRIPVAELTVEQRQALAAEPETDPRPDRSGTRKRK